MAVRLPYGVRKCHYRKGNVTIKDLLEGLQGTYGVLTLIVLIGLAGAAGKWVWGWTYQECKAREQEWRGIALDLLMAGHKAIDIVEKTTRGGRP
jgi:hypothetical protein